ncbi:hypothetical protein PUN28_003158 [Cardiocondyla obscurior]|uniref:Uncharacterized protein n=1 Tax=Cardiocondyla obscurior TaxID=286306 RepID=A0AAW2GJH9_9HYME
MRLLKSAFIDNQKRTRGASSRLGDQRKHIFFRSREGGADGFPPRALQRDGVRQADLNWHSHSIDLEVPVSPSKISRLIRVYRYTRTRLRASTLRRSLIEAFTPSIV